MMEWEHTRRAALTDDHLLPLINIVFLLLIFFMLVGAVTVPEARNVLPPSSVSAFQPSDQGVEIVIDDTGTILLDGTELTLTALITAMTRSEVPERVRLKADANIDANGVLDVLDVLRQAGVSNVQLVTVSKR